MLFQKWLVKKKLTCRQIIEMGVLTQVKSKSSLERFASGRLTPRFRVIEEIKRLTDGAVTVVDWYKQWRAGQ